mgnify:CR=1 FL=1
MNKKQRVTIIVAAYNTPDTMKTKADFVCIGINDTPTINAAIDSLSGKDSTIQLTPGTFRLDGGE